MAGPIAGVNAEKPHKAKAAVHSRKVALVVRKKAGIRMESGTNCGPKPDALYVGASLNKEYSPLYRHAWGTAYVSSAKGGDPKYAVDHIQFVITMPQPHGGDGIGRGDCNNAATCDADIKYGGADAYGDFTSDWLVLVTEPCYSPISWRQRW